MKKQIVILLFAACVMLVAACSNDDDGTSASKNYVLVHGAWQSAYVWNEVKDRLEKEGQHVIVVELPAHGDDASAPADQSIDSYTQKVVSSINAIQGDVILVGHSMAGIVISQAAEQIPQRIEKLLYIGAYVPVDGQSLLDLAMQDEQSLLPPALVFSETTIDVKQEERVDLFCADGSDAVKEKLEENFKVEPLVPFTNKVTLTPGRFGSTSKAYIHTTLDNVIGMKLQSRMVTAAAINDIHWLNSSHSPFLSMPEEVTKILLQIGNE